VTRLRDLGLSVPVTVAIDPVVWKTHYVHGIPLGADAASTGLLQTCASIAGEEGAAALAQQIDELSSETVAWHLRCALSELQLKIGRPFGLVVVKSPPVDAGLIQGVHYDKLMPRRPYTHGEGESWYRIDVPGPVLSVQRLRAYYYGQLIWEFSQARGNIDLVRTAWQNMGVNHILPINFQSIIVTQSELGGPGNYGVWHTLGAHRSPVPDFWAVDYTTGPFDRETGTPEQIPLVLVNWVMAVAGQALLGIAGMARTGGVTNQSVSFDGLSRSVGLSQSGQAGLYGALEANFKAIEQRIDWKQVRAALRGIRVRKFSY
jgi:hypothetical protein